MTIGTFGEAPYGATKRLEGGAEMGGATPYERAQWDLGWSSLWGHETFEGCGILGIFGGGDARELPHWDIR